MTRSLARVAILLVGMLSADAQSQGLEELRRQNEALFRKLEQVHDLTDDQMAEIRAIFARSRYTSQGNPAITVHPVTTEQCRAKLRAGQIDYANPRFETICDAKYMAPLFDPLSQTVNQAAACIDQFEFPNIPCEYPVVWVRANEAAQICHAMGKRLCDAHEWEGACAGALQDPDYRFDVAVGKDPEEAIRLMRQSHNRKHSPTKTWSYGTTYKEGICSTSGSKTEGCTGGSWTGCGSNTFPSAFFPECRSSLMVYDLNGNAAEHMNLPLKETQMSSRGSDEYGYTEMKGSWFIFDTHRAHDDWCRWRAPFWHGSRVMDAKSHHNYHLGFRCCKSVTGETGNNP